MRIRKKKWTERELASSPRMIHDPSEYKGCWHKYFHNSNPIHLELGCGKGRFITALSSRCTEINYLAFERDRVVIATGVRASAGLECSLGFIVGEARDLPNYFDRGEISRIYLNFSDPWPGKKKWAKRRLTHGAFLDTYKELMGDNGEIFFKTDNKVLFEFSLNQFCEKGWSLRNIFLDLHNSKYNGRTSAEDIRRENIMTEYEERFHSMGQPIYSCEAYYLN